LVRADRLKRRKTKRWCVGSENLFKSEIERKKNIKNSEKKIFEVEFKLESSLKRFSSHEN
jgi:hypothetical protein